LFNGFVAKNCHDAMSQDQIGVGFIFVLALGIAVAVAALTSVVSGYLSARMVWSSRLRWAGVALAALGLAAALGAGSAVRDSMCRYTGGSACGPGRN